MGAYGEGASAQYARQMWVVAKLVRDNPVVGAEFDRGVDGLLSRLDSVSDATEFRTAFAGFITECGHRGPNDWEISSRTWENTPELALTAIDRMRLAEHDLDPPSRMEAVDQRRSDAVAKVLPHLNVMDKVTFKKAVTSMVS